MDPTGHQERKRQDHSIESVSVPCRNAVETALRSCKLLLCLVAAARAQPIDSKGRKNGFVESARLKLRIGPP